MPQERCASSDRYSYSVMNRYSARFATWSYSICGYVQWNEWWAPILEDFYDKAGFRGHMQFNKYTNTVDVRDYISRSL